MCSFCMEYEPEFDTFSFDEQCDDSLHASLLASLTSLPLSPNESLPSEPSSSSLELKSLSSTLKYAFLGPNETFPISFDSGPRKASPRLVKCESRGFGVDLRRH